MQLTYRGTSYHRNALAIETQSTGHLAHFLGKPYVVRRPIRLNSSSIRIGLKFRGVEYLTD